MGAACGTASGAAKALREQAVEAAARGDYDSAISHLQQALEIDPRQAVWYRDLAVFMAAVDRWAESGRASEASLELNPGDREAQMLRARAWAESGAHEAALLAYEQLEEAGADPTEVLYGRSRALLATGQAEEAVAALRRSIGQNPNSAKSHELLAHICRQLTAYEEDYEHCRAAVRLRHGDAEALAHLGVAAWETGRIEESVATLRSALRIAPEARYIHSTLLHCLLHDPSQSGATLREEHVEWNAIHSLTGSTSRYANSPEPERRLRIGYLTGEFMENPTYFFVLPVIRKYNPEAVETFAYHTRPLNDPCTAAYRDAFDHWRDVPAWADEEIAAAIRRDEIDILVDVSGHFPYHGLAAFSLRPAPVQVTFANYPATTGLCAFDYIFTDRWTCPPGHESWYVERPWRLASGYFAWEPVSGAPATAEPPFERNGAITFGIFQRPSKLNACVWDAVGAVMRAVPRSRLLIHQGTRDLDEPAGAARTRYTAELEPRGISAARIAFRGSLDWRAHMDCVAQADIALDTFPYSGQTTTCECLWMGLPVVSLTGDTHASRVGASILHRVGHPEWIADSPQQYVNIAAMLAADPIALSRIRAGLRDEVRLSPLHSPARVAREIEAAYREMWRLWCANHG